MVKMKGEKKDIPAERRRSKSGGIIDRVMMVHNTVAAVTERCDNIAAELSGKKQGKPLVFDDDVVMESSSRSESLSRVVRESASLSNPKRSKRYVDEGLAEQVDDIRDAVTNDITDTVVKERLLTFLNKYQKLQNHERELMHDREATLAELRADMLLTSFHDYLFTTKPERFAEPACNDDDCLGDPDLTASIRANKARLRHMTQLEKRLVATEAYFKQLKRDLEKSKRDCIHKSKKLDIDINIKESKGPVERLEELLVHLSEESLEKMSPEECRNVKGATYSAIEALQILLDQKKAKVNEMEAEYEEKQAEIQKMSKAIATLNNPKKKNAKDNQRQELVEWCTSLMQQMNKMENIIKKGMEESEEDMSKLKTDLSEYKADSANPQKLLGKFAKTLVARGFSRDEGEPLQWSDMYSYTDKLDQTVAKKLTIGLRSIHGIEQYLDEQFTKSQKMSHKFLPSVKDKYGPINQIWKVPNQQDMYETHLKMCVKTLEALSEVMTEAIKFRFDLLAGVRRLNNVKMTGKFESNVILFDLTHPVTFDQVKTFMLNGTNNAELMSERWKQLRTILTQADNIL